MATRSQTAGAPQEDEVALEDIPVEEFEPTEEQKAQTRRQSQQFLEHLLTGNGADPALMSINETLMPGGAVIAEERSEHLEAKVPEDLASATVRELAERWCEELARFEPRAA